MAGNKLDDLEVVAHFYSNYEIIYIGNYLINDK